MATWWEWQGWKERPEPVEVESFTKTTITKVGSRRKEKRYRDVGYEGFWCAGGYCPTMEEAIAMWLNNFEKRIANVRAKLKNAEDDLSQARLAADKLRANARGKKSSDTSVRPIGSFG